MSGTPPRAPTPDPDIEEDKQGLQESFNVIKARKLPTTFRQNGTTLCPESPIIGTGQDLRDIEFREDPNDTSTAKIKTPEMETLESLMWRSYVQHCAICHGGATPRPSQTSNASFRECSSLCMKARPHECVPGATAPATVTGSSAAPPPSPLPPPPPPPRPVSAPAEDFQRGVKCDITHYEEFKCDDQWDEWSRAFIVTINTHGCKNVINPRYVAGTNDAQGLLDSQQEFAQLCHLPAHRHLGCDICP